MRTVYELAIVVAMAGPCDDLRGCAAPASASGLGQRQQMTWRFSWSMSFTCIPWGANLGLGQAVLQVFGVAKVADLHKRPFGAVQEGVLQLDVPVHHTLAMAVVHADDELLEKPPGLILAQAPSPLDILKQVSTLCQARSEWAHSSGQPAHAT